MKKVRSLKASVESKSEVIKAKPLTREEFIARNIAEVEELARTMTLDDYIRMREKAFAILEAIEDRELEGLGQTVDRIAERLAAEKTYQALT
jgi:hypothetical protein